MRFLITGASGFLGSWLVRRLLNDGHSVMAVVRPSVRHRRLEGLEDRLSFAYADLSTIASIRAEVESFAPQTTIHLAWQGGNSSRYLDDPQQVYANVPATLELLRISQQAGSSSFLFAGSCVEYGRYNIPVRETDHPSPQNLYGLSKYTVMQLAQALAHGWGMRFCGIRLFWTYGPMDDELRMIPYVISQLLGKRRPSVTAGEQMWDFLFVADAVKAIASLACDRNAQGVFNLGSGQPQTVRSVITMIRDLIDPSLEIGFGEVPYAPGQPMHLQADIAKMQKAVGWQPETSLAEGLKRTVDWHCAATR